MIVITGPAGFIGSCLVSKFNSEGITDLILVDKFNVLSKEKNLKGKHFKVLMDREGFPAWLASNPDNIEAVIHIGARTDTTEFNKAIFDELNVHYSQDLWTVCADQGIPYIYASSAATYGLGEHGYKDVHSLIHMLKPLNPYGDSKNEFDKWALDRKKSPPSWYGLKFFNVYGPNEYHKARMASVIFHSFNQIRDNGRVRLFRSHRPDYKDGGQLRDFVYVKDVVNVIWYLFKKRPANGIYNLGSGQARSFLDLANGVFKALGKAPVIDFIDTPADIRDKYQYFTEADMSKLQSTGYHTPFTSLEEGIDDYVRNYLVPGTYF